MADKFIHQNKTWHIKLKLNPPPHVSSGIIFLQSIVNKKCYKILLYLLRLPEAFLISDGRLFKILTHK
jgi:hypothetical protein